MDQPILEKSDIKKLIPHRDPILLINNVLSYSPEEIICSKYLDKNNPVFKGHFENNPIYPGIYLLEAMAQAGAVKINLDAKDNTKPKGTYVILKIENAKFKHPVLPSTIVKYAVSTTTIDPYHVMQCKALVNDSVVASAKITTMIK